jgi:uroporphyrinogen-III synthase
LQALVTRPREEAETLAAALARRGVEAVIAPLMQIHFLADEPIDLTGVQAILCTSANGVRALAQASGERRVSLFAVGDATAACARAEGFRMVESADGNADDLVRLAAERLDPRQGRLLHVAAKTVAGNLTEALGKRGFAVERRVLYEARPLAELNPSAVRALRGGTIDFAMFFSPRTAAVFVTLAGAAGVAESCETVAALSISPATDAALAPIRWLDRRVAERPNQPALLNMLDRVLGERQRA